MRLNCADRPFESDYRMISTGPHWCLREYADAHAEGRPSVLIVPAPIKRPYIWDFAPSVSAVRHCLDHRFCVYLVQWTSASDDVQSIGVGEHAKDAISECVARVTDETQDARSSSGIRSAARWRHGIESLNCIKCESESKLHVETHHCSRRMRKRRKGRLDFIRGHVGASRWSSHRSTRARAEMFPVSPARDGRRQLHIRTSWAHWLDRTAAAPKLWGRCRLCLRERRELGHGHRESRDPSDSGRVAASAWVASSNA